jgi:hypothetical protein
MLNKGFWARFEAWIRAFLLLRVFEVISKAIYLSSV